MDILGIPIAQFGAEGSTTTIATKSSSMDGGGDLFKPANFVAAENTSVPNNISAITMSLVQKYPKIRANALMSHSLLTYEDGRIGNKGACLNYNLLGLCSDPKCNYRHARAKPTPDGIKPSSTSYVRRCKATLQAEVKQTKSGSAAPPPDSGGQHWRPCWQDPR
jgi:hypothetical protein